MPKLRQKWNIIFGMQLMRIHVSAFKLPREFLNSYSVTELLHSSLNNPVFLRTLRTINEILNCQCRQLLNPIKNIGFFNN